jgi:hypothetical protein
MNQFEFFAFVVGLLTFIGVGLLGFAALNVYLKRHP